MGSDRLRAPGRAAARVGLGLVVLVLTACFEEPVEERLALCFLADGTVVVTARTRVSDGSSGGDNPALDRRLAEARRALADGDDEWARRFRGLDAIVERRVLDLEGGEVREARRMAAGIEPEGLRRLFADGNVAALYHRGEERSELIITAGGGTRATEEQRRKVGEAVASWAALLARYAADTAALYAYLGQHPDRAEPCFSVLFSQVTRKAGEELKEREGALVQAVSDDLDEAVKVFEVAEGEAYTMNELSHLVYDPFPARVEVRLGAGAIDVEGFRPQPDGSFVIAGLGLWEAFEALEGHWVAPDPLGTLVRAQRDRRRPFDLAAFTALPRRAGKPPSPDEVRSALERWLTPAPVYRLAWPAPAPESGQESGGFDWDTVHCP